MPAGDGLQPDVLCRQDSRAHSDRLLLASALVPWYSGPGTGGNSVHHHHLHPEVMRSGVQTAPAFLFVQYLQMQDSNTSGCYNWNKQLICDFRGRGWRGLFGAL